MDLLDLRAGANVTYDCDLSGVDFATPRCSVMDKADESKTASWPMKSRLQHRWRCRRQKGQFSNIH